MKTLFRFIMRSSADAQKTSMTVKFFLIGLIPFVMNATNMVCEIGYSCMRVDETLLQSLADGISLAVFAILSLVSAVGIVFGLIRKITLTASGKNEAIR